MPSLGASNPTPERIDLHTAADEIGNRLEELKRRVCVVRTALIGEIEEKAPSLRNEGSDLEAKIFAFTETLDAIEFAVGRIGARLGVSFTQASAGTPGVLVPKPRA